MTSDPAKADFKGMYAHLRWQLDNARGMKRKCNSRVRFEQVVRRMFRMTGNLENAARIWLDTRQFEDRV